LNDIEQVDEETLDKIKHFFEHYKELEKDKFVKVIEWKNKDVAEQLVTDGMHRFREENSRN
jgi:inorganic pyrophosphatase